MQHETAAVARPREPELARKFMQALIIAALCAAPAIWCIHSVTAADPDIWWHMRTGEWILQHRAVPQTDPFSSFTAGKSWAAYSWLFELLVLQWFRHFGLVGLNLFTAAMVAGITAASYHLFRRLQSDFAVAVVLTCVTFRGLMGLYTPRPWLFSILFFVLQLDILLHARRTGKTRELLWLPLMYVVWANIHIQFANGLLVLGIAVAEAVAANWWGAIRSQLRLVWTVAIFATCLLATLVNPYGWGIYKVAHDLATQPGVLETISELQALAFRSTTDYVVVFIAIGAAFALGWQRRLQTFEILLFVYAVWASFRSRRDIWIVILSAAALLASALVTKSKERKSAGLIAVPVTIVLVTLVLGFGPRLMQVNNQVLQSMLETVMPVKAVENVQAHQYPGPLFNDYSWGGYLIWSLRYPVNIDGRAALHGDEHLSRSFSTWSGEPDWRKDPELDKAGLVIGPVKSPLTQLLRMDQSFQLVYEDKVAAVFIPRNPHPPKS